MVKSPSTKFTKHYPAKIFLVFWIGMFLLRGFGFMAHDHVVFSTYLTIILFCSSFILGYYLGVMIRIKDYFKFQSTGLFFVKKLDKNMNLLVNTTIVLSLVCCITQLIKLKTLSNFYNVDGVLLEMFSQVRISKQNDSSYQLGENFYGVISNILYGFPVLAIFLHTYCRTFLDKKRRILLILCYILGLFISFTGGGRFTAFAFIFMYYFLRKIYLHRVMGSTINRTKYKFKGILSILFIVGIFYIFGQVFIVRLGSTDALMNYLDLQNFNHPKDFAKTLVEVLPSFSVLIQVLMLFDYYITHSIDQLNYLLTYPYPSQGPYWGAYQFSAFALLFNKLGFEFKTIPMIDSEIVNPGVYFSMIGGVYLDYGYLGICWFTFIIGVLTAISFTNYLRNRNLISAFWSCIFLVIISISPIISMIGTGYFSSIITTGIFLFLFNLCFPLPPISNIT
ncbi:MAG: hypothetical protein EAZ67_10970 [Cytophagales bacterium]|nr:MAG: hypothetical protein EAZ67_10970 [Cytophagales bacterium]